MSDCVIRLATQADAALIHEAAVATWEPTYRSIISQEQIEVMFEDLLSMAAIKRQIMGNEGTYVLAIVGEQAVGFGYFNVDDHSPTTYKLHRLYMRPGVQRSGIGSQLLAWIERYLCSIGAQELVLNVNRYNSAQEFYHKNGYDVVDIVDIPYRQFYLNDYVMKKALR